MSDVLAKPFIREGMQRMLRKHLPHLLATPSPPAPNTDSPYAGVQAEAALNGEMQPDAALATGHMAMKFEGTPIESPSGQAGAWGSPGGMTSQSPSGSPMGMGGLSVPGGGGMGGGGGMPGGAGIVMGGQMERYTGFMGPMEDRPEKRRRVAGQRIMG